MDNNELGNRFRHHPPQTNQTAERHADIRTRFEYLAQEINRLIPDGREKSTCLTHLEEGMYWANAAVARNQ